MAVIFIISGVLKRSSKGIWKVYKSVEGLRPSRLRISRESAPKRIYPHLISNEMRQWKHIKYDIKTKVEYCHSKVVNVECVDTIV